MGSKERWIAVRGRSFEEIGAALRANSVRQLDSLRQYHVESSDQTRNAAGALVDGRIYGFQNGDWYILLLGSNNWHSVAGADAISLRLSEQNADVINTSVNESVNQSEVKAYKNNQRLWSIIHDGEKGRYHLQTSGTMPDCYERIKELVMSPSLPEPPKRTLPPLPRPGEPPKIYRSSAFEVPVRVSRAIIDYSYSLSVSEDMAIHCFELA